MRKSNKQLEIMDNILGNKKLSDPSQKLSSLLFELTDYTSNKLVQVRDYEEISKKGTFKYAGAADTMYEEGFMPKDVFEELNQLKIKNHIGPSYLRVKGLLTFSAPRKYFGKKLSSGVMEYLEEKPLSKEDGFIVCIPNMTGGAWIGDITRSMLQEREDEISGSIWPCTPYAREMRKVIEVSAQESKIEDFVEGPLPSPEDTSAIICFEELRTAAETTRNALNIYERFGYNKENDVRLIAASVFDYKHPAGTERLKRMNVDGICVVDGKEFLDASYQLNHISKSQLETAFEWLHQPWTFTRKVIPDLKKLLVK